MLNLLWNISTAIRGYLRFYMPTNVAIDLLRARWRLKWAIPTAVVAVPVYLYATSVATTVIERGGPGWLNVLVILFFWNAMKFAWVAVLNPFRLLTLHLRARQDLKVRQTATSSSELGLG